MASALREVCRRRQPWQQCVIERIRESLRVLWPTAVLQVYGSFRTGLTCPSSDIDLLVVGAPPPPPARAPQTNSCASSMFRMHTAQFGSFSLGTGMGMGMGMGIGGASGANHMSASTGTATAAASAATAAGGSRTRSRPRSPQHYQLWVLASHLEREEFVSSVRVIDRTAIPVIKLTAAPVPTSFGNNADLIHVDICLPLTSSVSVADASASSGTTMSAPPNGSKSSSAPGRGRPNHAAASSRR